MSPLIRRVSRSIVLIFLLNFVLINNNGGLYTEAKAANILNNWTLPEEGFPVFYRFFRDKISWFEADAVCQFHHGNLVTVNNGIQFDASRAFLKELDVVDMVWIGLKSSQGSSRFTWANMNPLDNNAGYWAESFPSVETPLCAAVDPAKDFRWHSLKCGGPDTAAFLCELPVPEWGSQCTITAMPSVTIQYLSDAPAIRLSRDCGNEEGERHVLCRGGEDRGTVLSQLACNSNGTPQPQSTTTVIVGGEGGGDDEDVAAASPSSTDSSVSMAINKIVTEIQSIATNDTELQSVAKKVDIKGGDEIKQEKKFALKKKYISAEKKQKRLQMEKEQRINNPLIIDQDADDDEPMQGDAPALVVDQYSNNDNDDDISSTSEAPATVTVELISNDTTEYLRPRKRMPVQDLRKRPKSSEMPEERIRRETLNVPNTTEAAMTDNVETKLTTVVASSSSLATTTLVSLAETDLSTTTESSTIISADLEWSTTDKDNNDQLNETVAVEATVSSSTGTAGHPMDAVLENYERPGTPHSAQPKGAITHPMHINSDMTKELIEVNEKVHKKNNNILANHLENEDHFVPPMLLVKTKFVPGKQHPDAVHENHEMGETNSSTVNLNENATETTINDISKFYPASTQKAIISEISADNLEMVKDILNVTTEEKSGGVIEKEVAVIDPSSSSDDSSNQTAESKISTAAEEVLPSTSTTTTTTTTSSSVAHPSDIISIGQEPVRKLTSESEFTFTNIDVQPHRPNRRRSLTKHESVSYLRKILG